MGVIGDGMRGPSGIGRLANWRRQGPHFRPRSTPPSTRPRDINFMKAGIQVDMERAVIDVYGSVGEAWFSVGGCDNTKLFGFRIKVI